MQIQFTANPGTSLSSKSLPNGQMIKGIQLDNPSGNWLYVVSEQIFCPPYTIGWAMPTTYDQSSVTIEARLVGPASQVGTNQGEAWSLNLFDYEVAPSTGTPYQFVQQFTPLLTVRSNLITATLPVPATVITIAPIVGKRIRLRTVAVNLFADEGNCNVQLWDASQIWEFTLRAPRLYEYLLFPDGFDLVTGASFSIIVQPTLNNVECGALVAYQVV